MQGMDKQKSIWDFVSMLQHGMLPVTTGIDSATTLTGYMRQASEALIQDNLTKLVPVCEANLGFAVARSDGDRSVTTTTVRHADHLHVAPVISIISIPTLSFS